MKTSWKSERSEKAKSAPTCCRQRNEYPPGYTVFECRLDGNQPIAQVVQVPSDTTDKIIQNKTCMLLETKQSESGPSSRVVAYPAAVPSCRRRQTTEPMSFALESRDCPGGAVARAEKVAEHVDGSSAMCSTQPVTILETTKGPTCRNGPSSQIVYGSLSQEAEKSSRFYETPGFHIQCTTTREGPIARVIQVPKNSSSRTRDPGTTYEAFVHHDGSFPTAMVTQCNKKQEISQNPCEFLETKVDASGPRAKALTLPEGSPNFRHFTHLDVRPQENGPFARISQYLGKPQENISNPRPKEVNAPNCRARSTNGPQRPIKPVRNYNQPPKQNVFKSKPNIGKRNGLSPLSSEQQVRTDPFKNCRIKGAQKFQVPESCPAQCSRPVSSPGVSYAACEFKPATCGGRTTSTSVTRSKSACPKPVNCRCPVQHVCEETDLPFSKMRPLPGGTVVPQCPPPSLPEIAPVLVGVNNFRNHKPSGSKPKTSRPRKPNPAPPPTSNKPINVILKPKKITKSATAKKKPKKKNPVSSSISVKTLDQPLTPDPVENDQPLIPEPVENDLEGPDPVENDAECPDPVENDLDCPDPVDNNLDCPDPPDNNLDCPDPVDNDVHCPDPVMKNDVDSRDPVNCPASECKEVQSVNVCENRSVAACPDFESKGNQCIRVCKKSLGVDCSDYQSGRDRICEELTCIEGPTFQYEKRQSTCICGKPSCFKCPAYETEKRQLVCVHKKPYFLECPAFQAEKRQLIRTCEKSSNIDCPAFEAERRQLVCIRKELSVIECQAIEAEKRQMDRACEKSSSNECPAFQTEKRQMVRTCEIPSFIECPAVESEKCQMARSCKKPTVIECPAFEAEKSKLHRSCDNASFIECPAFESEKRQMVRTCNKPTFIECPAFEAENSKLDRSRDETSFIKCPAFETEKRKSDRACEKRSSIECPAFESEKRKMNRACEKASFTECPAFESEKCQSVRVCEKSTYVKRPRCKSKKIQSSRFCNNQLYVKCPAFESRDNQLNVPEESSYLSHLERIRSICRRQSSEETDFVKCPAFTTRKSSGTSSIYVPRDQLVSKYSEYFRPKTLTTAVDCCAKRNRLQDECRPHIPQTVLRMTYEQRRNRHARTLLSNGSLRRRFGDEDADRGMSCCVRV